MKKVILTILDGYGLGENSDYNAIHLAKKPNLDRIFEAYKSSTLIPAGKAVGLPEGTMGNSEVGHLNIGAGRIVFQDISRINNSIEDGSFYENKNLNQLIQHAKKNGKKLHLLGLISDGGVHSSLDHLKAILDKCNDDEFDEVYLHAFMDGRDTPPDAGLGYLQDIEEYMSKTTGEIATISGRFYAMDRDNRWERVEKAYNVLVNGRGEEGISAEEIMEGNYQKEITDEFIVPSVIIDEEKNPIAKIEKGDSVLFFNFRADRARELSITLNDPDFKEFSAEKLDLLFMTMTSYRDDFTYPNLFPKEKHEMILGEVISKAGLNQLRIAETEKFAHVTFFFNGGIDKVFDNEERILIPSPKVETYDLQPEMSAYEVKDKVVEALNSKKYELIILNFANCDMVGHTGDLKAAIKAVEAVDNCVGEIYKAVKENDYTMLITADHGNAEKMKDGDKIFTAHTKNLVPFLITEKNLVPKDGKLADLAPTILKIMDLEIPQEMTGNVLI